LREDVRYPVICLQYRTIERGEVAVNIPTKRLLDNLGGD